MVRPLPQQIVIDSRKKCTSSTAAAVTPQTTASANADIVTISHQPELQPCQKWWAPRENINSTKHSLGLVLLEQQRDNMNIYCTLEFY